MRKITNRLVAILLVATMLIPICGLHNICAASNETAKEVELLFTHDFHSNMDSFTTYPYRDESNSAPIKVGGVARLKTLIDEKRKEYPDLLCVDAGDFPMGTLYQSLYETEAVEYRMLGRAGIEATVLGNHDFDYGSEGMANMYHAAAASGDVLPTLLVSNIDWMDGKSESKMIHDAMLECGMKEYTVFDKGGVKIACFGLLGEDALACAPRCELTWMDPIESAKNIVKKIKANEDVDMIVCLSHCGYSELYQIDEDTEIAKAVPDIDVIVSGHTHDFFTEPVKVKNTTILAAGCYGYYTGLCHFTQNKKGRWDYSNYELIRMNESIAEDEQILAELAEFSEEIDEKYLSQFDYTADEILARNDIKFDQVEELISEHAEHSLGSFIADAYRYAFNRTPSGMEHYADVGICPAGTVRDTYYPGDITVSDTFRSFSLGTGADGITGYPLISVYFTGKELKTLAEIDASVSDFYPAAGLYTSGLSFSFNTHRILLNRVNDIWLSAAMLEESRTELEDKKLYRVVTDMYSGEMLESVNGMSYGLLSLKPKKADGTPLTDFNDAIVYQADGTELKAWVAIAQYLESFEKDSDGISHIPQYYATLHNRKVVDESLNPISLCKMPNKIGLAVVGIVVLLIVVIILIIRGAIRHNRKKKVFINAGE